MQHPRTVYLVARWTYYTAFGQLLEDIPTGKRPTAEAERLDLLATALNRTVRAYQKTGASLVAIGQVPEQSYSPRKIYRALYVQPGDRASRLRHLSVSTAHHFAEQASVNQILRSEPGLQFIDPTPALCTDGYCPMGTPKASFYFDIDHLSVLGALKLLPLIEDERSSEADSAVR